MISKRLGSGASDLRSKRSFCGNRALNERICCSTGCDSNPLDATTAHSSDSPAIRTGNRSNEAATIAELTEKISAKPDDWFQLMRRAKAYSRSGVLPQRQSIWMPSWHSRQSELGVGDYRAVATATDGVGLRGLSEPIEFTVKPVPELRKEEPPAMTTPKPDEPALETPVEPKVGTIKGIVTLGTLRPQGVIVTLADQKEIQPVKTDAEGRFRFDDVPIGKQTVTAKFIFQGLIHRGSKADVEPKPDEEAEWFRLPLRP